MEIADLYLHTLCGNYIVEVATVSVALAIIIEVLHTRLGLPLLGPSIGQALQMKCVKMQKRGVDTSTVQFCSNSNCVQYRAVTRPLAFPQLFT